MSSIQRFCRPGSVFIERQVDRWNGEGFIAWKPYTSMCFTNRKALLRFIAWPAKTPTGDEIREWLRGFDPAVDRELPTHDPQPALSLSSELLATGFGPEVHALDESDPNYLTRTIT
jgi:hypothetical protein